MVAQFRVANVAQKVLFEQELVGQFSDGHWENSWQGPAYVEPGWMTWGRADVIVDPDHVGRNFGVHKDNYNLTDPRLLEVVGDRMMQYVRLALVFGDKDVDNLQSLADVLDRDDRVEFIKRSTYFRELVSRMRGYDFAEVKRVANDESLYNEKQLLKDLRELKKAMKQASGY